MSTCTWSASWKAWDTACSVSRVRRHITAKYGMDHINCTEVDHGWAEVAWAYLCMSDPFDPLDQSSCSCPLPSSTHRSAKHMGRWLTPMGPCEMKEDDLELDKKAPTQIHAVELLDGGCLGALPNFIEIEGVVTVEKVTEELIHWGHQVRAFDCDPHNKFFCVSSPTMQQTPGTMLYHYLFCHQDVKDEQGLLRSQCF